jgi:hypothetical protein
MATPRPWTVLPHDPWERLTDNVWSVSGALPGMALRRRMTAVKLADGRVVIHGAACLEEPAMRELEAWGEPGVLIVPNPFHRLDAHAWKARYPGITVLCAKDADAAVRQVVAVDGHFDAFPADPKVSLTPLRGMNRRVPEAVLSAEAGDGRAALVFNDALFNHPHMPGFMGWVVKTLGSTGGPRITSLISLVGVSDRKALAEHYRSLAATPGLAFAVPGHGAVIDGDVKATLTQVAAG